MQGDRSGEFVCGSWGLRSLDSVTRDDSQQTYFQRSRALQHCSSSFVILAELLNHKNQENVAILL